VASATHAKSKICVIVYSQYLIIVNIFRSDLSQPTEFSNQINSTKKLFRQQVLRFGIFPYHYLKVLKISRKSEAANLVPLLGNRVTSFFPFPNSRIIPVFSGSLFPKIPEILLANSNLN